MKRRLAEEHRSAATDRRRRWPDAAAAAWARWRVFKARTEWRKTPTGQEDGWNLGSLRRLSLAVMRQAQTCCQESLEMPLSEVRSLRSVCKGPWQRWLWSRMQTASILLHRSRPMAICVWISVGLPDAGEEEPGLMRHDAATGGSW